MEINYIPFTACFPFSLYLYPEYLYCIAFEVFKITNIAHPGHSVKFICLASYGARRIKVTKCALSWFEFRAKILVKKMKLLVFIEHYIVSYFIRDFWRP